VKDEFREGDWLGLTRYCFEDKQSIGENMDVADIKGEFPLDLLEDDAQLVGYKDVFPFAPVFEFEYEGKQWAVTDAYCVEPTCSCREALLEFLSFGDESGDKLEIAKAIPAVRYDYRSGKVEVVDPPVAGQPTIRDLVGSLRSAHPSLPVTLREHHARMKSLYRRTLIDKGLLAPVHTRAEPKVGRNDPCPCGSGKKYKKCCGK